MLKKIRKLYQIVQNRLYLKTLLISGVAASTEHIRVFKNLTGSNFKTIVDIGANRGQCALMARNYFPDAQIFSFEPLNEPAAVFRKIFSGDARVKLYPVAIGATEGSTKIHVSSADDSSSLLPISALQDDLFPGTSEKEERPVEVKRLDMILRPDEIKWPAFLKMDVQGFEKEALEGCGSLLPLFSYIYVECSFVELYVGQSLVHDIITYLRPFGFILAGVYNLDYEPSGKTIQGDFLFKKSAS